MSMALAHELNRDRCMRCEDFPHECELHCSANCNVHANSCIVPQSDIAMLGVDYTAGKCIKHARMCERLKNAIAKDIKIRRLAKGHWRVIHMMCAHVVRAVT